MPRARFIFACLLLPVILIIFVYSFLIGYYKDTSTPIASSDYLHLPSLVAHNNSLVYERRSLSRLDLNAETSSTDGSIDVLQEFVTLDHNPVNTSFWTDSLEHRYRHNKPQFPLKVILLPHSHNDPGWLSTYDQYFYQYSYYILDNAVKALSNTTDMTFIWAEMSFLSRWWQSLHSDVTRNKLRSLLKQSRFEIATGGWVMTDEGPAHYVDMLDQLIEGHQFLRTTLGYDKPPATAWSIDPFGHGATFAYLLRRSGIARLYIQRTHHAWKSRLAHDRSLEFIWRQAFERVAPSVPLLCHMSPLNLYSFKYTCGPEHKKCLEFDFRRIVGEDSESRAVPLDKSNIESKAKQIMAQYRRLASVFQHNVALVPLGDDFRYNFDLEWQQQYGNYKKLIEYVHQHPSKFDHAEISFGTLENYFSAMEQRQGSNYRSLVGDFMPYADTYVKPEPSYWTGYYTTRPFYKALCREMQTLLRTTEILYSLARAHVRQTPHFGTVSLIETRLDQDYAQLSQARQNLALFQHHDAITGTSKDFVMDDYAHRLAHSLQAMLGLAANCLQYLNLDLHTLPNANNSQAFVFIDALKSSWSEPTKKQTLRIPSTSDTGLKLIVFNSHLQWRQETVEFLVEDPFLKIIDIETGFDIRFQVNPVYHPSTASASPISSKVFAVEFVDTFEPLSTKVYRVVINSQNIEAKATIVELDEASVVQANAIEHSNNEVFVFQKASHLVLESSKLKLIFNKTTGHMQSVLLKHTNQEHKVRMSFAAYRSKPGQSGAYLFRPTNEEPSLLFENVKPTIHMIRGVISSTLLVNYTDIAYSVKLYDSAEPAISLVVHTNLQDKFRYDDQEIVLRIETNIHNREMFKNGQDYRTFHVDSNGFQMVKRAWIPSVNVSGNYYPMTTAMYIQDAQTRLSLLSSFSHGVTSPLDGSLEVMLDRRIVQDDLRGLGQGVLDNLPIEARFWLLLEPRNSVVQDVASLSKLADNLLLQLNYPLTLAYSYRPELDIVGNHASSTYYRHRKFLATTDWMCEEDLFLVNLRTLPTWHSFELASHSSLLILHRRRPQLASEEQRGGAAGCRSHKSHDEPIESLLEGVQVLAISETSLTALHTIKEDVHRLAHLRDSIPAYELSSFNVTFM